MYLQDFSKTTPFSVQSRELCRIFSALAKSANNGVRSTESEKHAEDHLLRRLNMDEREEKRRLAFVLTLCVSAMLLTSVARGQFSDFELPNLSALLNAWTKDDPTPCSLNSLCDAFNCRDSGVALRATRSNVLIAISRYGCSCCEEFGWLVGSLCEETQRAVVADVEFQL